MGSESFRLVGSVGCDEIGKLYNCLDEEAVRREQEEADKARKGK